MMQTLEIGPLVIQEKLLILLIAGLLGYRISLRVLRPLPESARKKGADLIFSMSLIPILVWKFGPFVAHPVHFFQNPIFFLFSKGTSVYWTVGFILSFIYVVYRLYQDTFEVYYILDAFTLGLTVFLSIQYLFILSYGKESSLPWAIAIDHSSSHYQPINFYHFVGMVCIGVWFVYKRYKVGTGQFTSTFCVLLGIGNMLVSYASVQRVVALSLSTTQWGDLALIGLGWYLMNNRKERTDEADLA